MTKFKVGDRVRRIREIAGWWSINCNKYGTNPVGIHVIEAIPRPMGLRVYGMDCTADASCFSLVNEVKEEYI